MLGPKATPQPKRWTLFGNFHVHRIPCAQLHRHTALILFVLCSICDSLEAHSVRSHTTSHRGSRVLTQDGYHDACELPRRPGRLPGGGLREGVTEGPLSQALAVRLCPFLLDRALHSTLYTGCFPAALLQHAGMYNRAKHPANTMS